MKQLEQETNPAECAAALLDVVPVVWRFLRAEIRRERGEGLSLPEFRALAFLNRNAGAASSAVAEHVGLTPPSASKMLDSLIARDLVKREPSLADRRRVTLTATSHGKSVLRKARERAEVHLVEVLSSLQATDRATVVQAMAVLRGVFARVDETERN